MVSQVREHLQRATKGILSDTERAVVMWYVQDLLELVSSIRELVGHWETYLDNTEQQNESTAYCVPVYSSFFRQNRVALISVNRHQLEILIMGITLVCCPMLSHISVQSS